MVKVPERFKWATPCPNEAVIAENNNVTPQLIRQYEEMQDISHLVSDLVSLAISALTELSGAIGKMAKSTGDMKVAEEKGTVDGYRNVLESLQSGTDTRAMEEMEVQIETSINKIGGLACSSCAGPIIDRVTGIAHCGRKVPPELTAAH